LQAQRRLGRDVVPATFSGVEVPVLRLGFDSSTPAVRRTIRTRLFSSIA
jgi:hypothetical protein